MSKLTDTFRNIFKIHELRQRIFYTLALLFIVRLGAHITLPGVDAALLTESMKNASSDNLFGLYDLFVGGAFSNAAIFALGISRKVKTAERKSHNLQGTELLESQLYNPGV
jgi:preprotein translocase subunit SecY